MKYFQLKLRCVFLLILTISLYSCSENQDIKIIKLAHGLDVNHSVHKAMIFMAERLSENSGGKLKIEIYPNQQLGTERQYLELLQIGSLGMAKVSGGVLENFVPKMKVFSIPFLFRDKEHSHMILDGEIGKELLLDGEKYWLRGLAYYDAGSRSFYTKDKPIKIPADLNGMKIRVLESVTAMDMVRELGGSPTPISWGELYAALQQGVVDGAENNPPSFYLSHHYEVCKYYSLDEHTIIPDILLIGTHVWNRLSAQEQNWLQEAADGSSIYQRKLWTEAEHDALEAVIKAGVQVIRPDKSAFIDKIKPIYDGYKDDTELYDLITRIQSEK